MVPVSEWTTEREGIKEVAIIGQENKREVTVLMSVTASGGLLPFEVIYQRKTVGRTGELQSLDLTVNSFFKAAMKAPFFVGVLPKSKKL